MYLVHRTSQTKAAFVTLNTGDGVEYHPPYPQGYPKDMRYTQLRFNSTVDEISDPAWLYLIFKIKATSHENHQSQILYDVCLPALVEGSLIQACNDQGVTQDQYAVPETLQRSGTCYYR